MVTVKLTYGEMGMGILIGVMRHVMSAMNGHKDGAGLNRNDQETWESDIEGALAEEVVAKLKGWYWGGTLMNFNGADIGDKIQVRWTGWKNGCLILREKDRRECPDHIFYLVRGRMPTYEVVGKIRGAAAMCPEFWTVPGHEEKRKTPYWKVPGERLFPENSQTKGGAHAQQMPLL